MGITSGHARNLCSEEAWTAQQALMQMQALTQLLQQQAANRVKRVETQAESFVREASHAETRESKQKQEVIEVATSILTDRDSTIRKQEEELKRLREEQLMERQANEIWRRDVQREFTRITDERKK